jgi:hypothetical protein
MERTGRRPRTAPAGEALATSIPNSRSGCPMGCQVRGGAVHPSLTISWHGQRVGMVPTHGRPKPRLLPQCERPGLLFARAEARRNSDALENLCASYPAAGEISAPPCDDGSRTDEAPGPVRGHVAIRCPVPPRLEDHPRAPNASSQPIRNSWTWSRWATDENSGEISSSINPQHLQHSAPLRLPHRRE